MGPVQRKALQMKEKQLCRAQSYAHIFREVREQIPMVTRGFLLKENKYRKIEQDFQPWGQNNMYH